MSDIILILVLVLLALFTGIGIALISIFYKASNIEKDMDEASLKTDVLLDRSARHLDDICNIEDKLEEIDKKIDEK